MANVGVEEDVDALSQQSDRVYLRKSTMMQAAVYSKNSLSSCPSSCL